MGMPFPDTFGFWNRLEKLAPGTKTKELLEESEVTLTPPFAGPLEGTSITWDTLNINWARTITLCNADDRLFPMNLTPITAPATHINEYFLAFPIFTDPFISKDTVLYHPKFGFGCIHSIVNFSRDQVLAAVAFRDVYKEEQPVQWIGIWLDVDSIEKDGPLKVIARDMTRTDHFTFRYGKCDNYDYKFE